MQDWPAFHQATQEKDFIIVIAGSYSVRIETIKFNAAITTITDAPLNQIIITDQDFHNCSIKCE